MDVSQQLLRRSCFSSDDREFHCVSLGDSLKGTTSPLHVDHRRNLV